MCITVDATYSSLWVVIKLLITVLMWYVLLFPCFVLSPCANKWGWFCVLGSCHSRTMCYLGFITSCPNLLSCFCFFLSLPPSSPLLLLFPPTGCAFVTFATRAMAQNAIKTMHHSQTMEVLYPWAPTSLFSPSYILLPPCVGKMNCPCIHQKAWVIFQKHSC